MMKNKSAIVITNTTLHDLPDIYRLFEEAILYQQKNNYTGWKNYDKAFLQQDVEKGLLYKIEKGDRLLGIFSTCYTDPLIWREKERGDAIYLHRIVANRQVNEGPIFGMVLAWAKDHAKQKQLRFIRMDTWAANEKIISYYKSFGFLFVEEYTTANTTDLPVQHRHLHVALLEMAL